MSVTVARHVAWEERGGVIYLATLPDGPIHVLAGGATELWRHLATGDGATEDVDADAVAGFVAELIDRGVLARDGSRT